MTNSEQSRSGITYIDLLSAQTEVSWWTLFSVFQGYTYCDLAVCVGGGGGMCVWGYWIVEWLERLKEMWKQLAVAYYNVWQSSSGTPELNETVTEPVAIVMKEGHSFLLTVLFWCQDEMGWDM
jgi:hypothetical protein